MHSLFYLPHIYLHQILHLLYLHLDGKMVNGIIDILVGFIIGIIENSSWFQSLFTNKLYISLIQGANKKVKDSDDTLESFYRELSQ